MQQPILDRIIIKRNESEEMFGSLHIPESAQEDVNRGTVIMVGPGKNGEPVGVEVGDQVIYSAFAGTEITINNEPITYFVIFGILVLAGYAGVIFYKLTQTKRITLKTVILFWMDR